MHPERIGSAITERPVRHSVSVEMLAYCCTNNANRLCKEHFQRLPRFIPLTGAFDTTDHVILLDRFSVTDMALSWIQSYLTNRSYSVRLGQHSSPRYHAV